MKTIKKIEMPHYNYTKASDIIRINEELGIKAQKGLLVPIRQENNILMLSEPRINGIWTIYLDHNGFITRITLF